MKSLKIRMQGTEGKSKHEIKYKTVSKFVNDKMLQ